MKSSARLLVLALAALALVSCAKSQEPAFNKKVHEYLLQHPEVLDEMVAKLQEKKRLDANKQAAAMIQLHRTELVADARDVVINPQGKLTIVEFFDFRCGYCKSSAPEVLRIIAENPEVRFVFKQFPIFGGESNLAAKVALSPAAKLKGLEVYRAFMAENALDEAAIDRNLATLGIDPKGAKLAAESRDIQKQIDDTHALAKSLNLEGTPAFIVGDRLIPGADLSALRAAVVMAKTEGLKKPG